MEFAPISPYAEIPRDVLENPAVRARWKNLKIPVTAGRLSVIGSIFKRGPDGRRIFVNCRCECGLTLDVDLTYLQGGNKTCCGCNTAVKRKMAARVRIGEGSPHWKGGKIVDKKRGYVSIRVPSHPRAIGKGGYVFEHILVMEEKMGRYVSRSESIHHINGEAGDNRIENLELWDTAHPHGQRHDDKMKFYMGELLKKCDRKLLAEFCASVLK